VHPGAVIILHDRVPQWEQTPEVLRMLLPELRKRGYKIVTLSELLHLQGDVDTKKPSS
jgi:peptidoglycan/xylan/chitin deacetylase (PgdA/CDA1 family)